MMVMMVMSGYGVVTRQPGCYGWLWDGYWMVMGGFGW